jgi:hypothetical protein
MNKIRARHKGKRNVYVHNDLSNAVHHFILQINDKLKREDLKGIAFEYMACMVMLAFAFEAKINFLGHKLIDNWKERQPFDCKVNEVFDHLRINPDWEARPYSSVNKLKEFRDSIAHGKPVEVEFDEEIIGLPEEIERLNDLKSKWESYCEHENVLNTSEDINLIWSELLSLSGLPEFQVITHGNSSLSFIEKIVDK